MSKKKGNMAADLIDAVETATKKWVKTKKSEERQPGYVRYRRARMTKTNGMSIKDAAWQVMEEAYLKASSNGTLPANARQIMYAARPKIQELTERPLEDSYFTQTLLPDYIEENAEKWDVVYDERGHFSEPHGKNRRIVPLGTLSVRSYLNKLSESKLEEASIAEARIDTLGPEDSFGAVLFIEKEGFTSLLDHVGLAKKYDIAIMSTKGVSVTAARHLIDEICSEYDLPLFVLHDFDVAGFTIGHTLNNDTRRYEFSNSIEAIDLGLRLDDVNELGLMPEDAAHTKSNEYTIRNRLLRSGATPEEAEFLLHSRVELNAMTSGQFVDLIERKLNSHGLKKVVPGNDKLQEVYKLFHRGIQIEKTFENLKNDSNSDSIVVPPDLNKLIQEELELHSDIRWDEAVRNIIESAQEGPKSNDSETA
jgi:hypothetical protein